MKEKNIKRIIRKNTGTLFLLLLGTILLFHSQYSFCQSDETFYISTVKRLWQGDRLILDEWHPTQFYTPILLPFYALFRLLAGSDSGVIHFFRIVTILLSIINSLLFYTDIRKEHSKVVSFCAAAMLMLFSRANIAGPSYYNLNLHFSIAALILWRRSFFSNGGKTVFQSSFGGLFLALAVLCQPYFAFFAVAFLLIAYLKQKTRRKAKCMIVTIMTVGILYVVVFLMKETPENYLENMRYVLSDPQHRDGLISNIFRSVASHALVLPVVIILPVILMCVWFVITRKRNNQLTYTQKLLQVGLVGLSLIKPFLRISVIPCYSFFTAITISTFPLFLYHLKTKEIRFAKELYILGICLAVSWGLGSNTGVDAMLTGYAISGLASLILLAKMLQMEGKASSGFGHQPMAVCFTCICFAVLLFSAGQRILGFYRDASIEQLNTRITQGPAKGLLTTAKSAEQYNTIYRTITEISASDPDATVFHAKKLPWAYLCCDWKCYGPTTWTTEISEPRLMEYYDSHGGYMADYMFIYAPGVGAWNGNYLNNHKTSEDPNLMDIFGDVYKRLTGSEYSQRDEQYMMIFSKTQ